MRGDFWPAVFGSVLGLALVAYPFVYLPMKRNYAECGKVTLCDLPVYKKVCDK